MLTKTDYKAIEPNRAKGQAVTMPVIQADRLFGVSRVVVIEHKGERYQLRLTQNGKLILTK